MENMGRRVLARDVSFAIKPGLGEDEFSPFSLNIEEISRGVMTGERVNGFQETALAAVVGACDKVDRGQGIERKIAEQSVILYG